jgi:hypothetical protein
MGAHCTQITAWSKRHLANGRTKSDESAVGTHDGRNIADELIEGLAVAVAADCPGCLLSQATVGPRECLQIK